MHSSNSACCSGHYTIEACLLSQYDVHLRAILGLPIPEESLQFNNRDTYAIMFNILGGAQSDSHLQVAQQALSIVGASIHLYGKGEARPGRKMGHITILASSMHEAQTRLESLMNLVDQTQAARKQGLSDRIQASANSHNPALGEPTLAAPPIVAVTMGSDSDRCVLSPGIGLLRELKIPFSVTITSAHRTPERMFQFAKVSASQGIRVIIAAAGGAAHLPGMVAANTWLPVIGIPVKGSSLDGMDSLLSIVQMPVRVMGVSNLGTWRCESTDTE